MMIPHNFLEAIAHEYHVSNAELEVLSLALQGESTIGIAQRIGISGDAVRKRLSEVYHKFHIPGRGPVKLTKLQQILIQQYQTQDQTQVFRLSDDLTPQTHQIKSLKSKNHHDWDNAPDVSVFYGRINELTTLKNWIVKKDCRLVSILGMGGVGKTTLSVRLAQQIQHQFDHVIWRSLFKSPSPQELLTDLIQSLAKQQDLPYLETLDQKINWLISYCRSHRCLIILDGLEAVLRQGELAGIYQVGYEGYGKLFRRFGEEPSKSCLLITSRENIQEISLLKGNTVPVRSLTLEGLGEASRLLLKEKGLSGENNWEYLIRDYRGNPLMLKAVANTIHEVFDGDVTDFLSNAIFTYEVTGVVQEMLQRLSHLETKILSQMGNSQTPVAFSELKGRLNELSSQDLISGLSSLRQRSLLEKTEAGFTLPPVIREVMAIGH
jgi:DNA-binding CsgD family transcriptional regulator/GTPase SAR1 family protein